MIYIGFANLSWVDLDLLKVYRNNNSNDQYHIA